METSKTELESGIFAAPQEEHRWLHQLVGEWTYEMEMEMEPGKPPEKFTGTETVRSLEGRWVVAEGEGTQPGGGTARTIMTLGFDSQKQRFVGTYVGTMMTYLWVYDGGLDAAEKVLTLDCDGPSMEGNGKLSPYQDVIEFKSDDHRTLTARVQGEDGQWNEIMTVHYRRKK